MCKNGPPTLSVHEFHLAVECLDTGHKEEAFPFQHKQANVRLSLQPREETYSVPDVSLHNLVRVAAEVLGAEAEEEVGG